MASLDRIYPWIMCVCIFLFCNMISCSKSSENTSSFEGELFIKLLDSPASLEQLNIVVNRVSIHRAGSSPDIGWTFANTEPVGPINILDLRNGNSASLVPQNKVPVGSYDQIKLHFGPCTVVENGLETLLNPDTIRLSGFILTHPLEILEGQQAQLTFDFNVFLSVKKVGSDYNFTPVIRVQNTLLSGSIRGSVLDTNYSPPVPIAATVRTNTGFDSVVTYTDVLSYGSFQLTDLPEKSYSITIVAEDPSFADTTINDLLVVRLQPTNVGAIHLKRK
jgi:hypothetical protein